MCMCVEQLGCHDGHHSPTRACAEVTDQGLRHPYLRLQRRRCTVALERPTLSNKRTVIPTTHAPLALPPNAAGMQQM